MTNTMTRLLSLCLALLMLTAALSGCGQNGDDPLTSDTVSPSSDSGTAETEAPDPAAEALERLDDIDWKGADFGILYVDAFASEVYGEKGLVASEGNTAQVINDALYERNALFEDKCRLSLSLIAKDQGAADAMIRNEAQAPTGDFRIMHYYLHLIANLALNGFAANYTDMDVDLDAPWWDTGTAEFSIDNRVFFMCGDANTTDDNVTYALFFNKKVAEDHAVGDLYGRVKAWDWTLDYFETLIQNISSDSNGDGVWNENDTYGFATNTAYGNTFFIGCDLRYILNDRETPMPTLYLDDHMDRAMDVLTMARSIYHDNNASYIAPSGHEPNSHAIFSSNRCLFFGEIAGNLTWLNANMQSDFGVLPVPKYDHAQAHYRTWTHGLGSCVAVTSAIGEEESEMIGDTLEVYAILAHQKLKPAYYDVLLSSRSVRDAESAEMLDLIFSNRVFDMAMYFDSNFGLWDLFSDCVNGNKDTFPSSYASKTKTFDRKLKNLLNSVDRSKKKN